MFHVKHSLEDTIAAIITPLGVGGVGVIRISGPKSFNILQKIASNKIKRQPNLLQITWLMIGRVKIDQALVAFMKAPNSYTGEDTVEISCHGSITGLKRLLAEICKHGGRMAEAGEFTKRSFINGKMDLSQAEAVIDLIEAKTDKALQNAARQMEGWLGREVKQVRGRIIAQLAGVEGAIDFPDEIAAQRDRLNKGLAKEVGLVNKLLRTAEEGRMVREGARVVIIGRPNVGKSSLMNALISSDRAIVSREAGTTRDTIEELVNIGGSQAVIIDTAGIRTASNEVEKEGVRRATGEIEKADLVVLVLEGNKGLTKADQMIVEQLKGKKVVIALNKIDLGDRGRVGMNYPQSKSSAKTGQGIPRLLALIKSQVEKTGARPKGIKVLINLRHKECLTSARESLIRGLAALERDDYQELVAEDLKSAIVALGEVSGESVSAEVIDQIFSRFCVGK